MPHADPNQPSHPKDRREEDAASGERTPGEPRAFAAGSGTATPREDAGDHGADGVADDESGTTYDAGQVEVNLGRMQGLGMGEEDLRRQGDPTRGAPEDRDPER